MADCNNKRVLYEESIIRPVIILLLVVMHSFTVFSGGGEFLPLPEGIEPIESYNRIAKVTYSFMLEAFVFVSGYLLAIFFEYIGFLNFLYDILNGTGHMWYLPILLWCFVLGTFLWNTKSPNWAKILICLLLSIGSGLLSGLPFRIGRTCYYLWFFYLGMFIYSHKQFILGNLSLGKKLLFTSLYLSTFVLLTLFKDILTGFMPRVAYTIVQDVRKLLFIIISNIHDGLLSLYLSAIYWLYKYQKWNPSKRLLVVNAICFGG